MTKHAIIECVQETNIALIQQEMENINKKLDEIWIKLDNLENKFARKWVENVWYFVFVAIWWAVLTAIIQLIIK